MSETAIQVRRLFTETDMAAAYIQGYVKGWVKTVPATDGEAVIRLFVDWLDKTYAEETEDGIRVVENAGLLDSPS